MRTDQLTLNKLVGTWRYLSDGQSVVASAAGIQW